MAAVATMSASEVANTVTITSAAGVLAMLDEPSVSVADSPDPASPPPPLGASCTPSGKPHGRGPEGGIGVVAVGVGLAGGRAPGGWWGLHRESQQQ